ncbi:MAG: response regulator [Pyrinomonadaceae bacterium]|nr:response regulator [Pyrinomonadaceae bacterium]
MSDNRQRIVMVVEDFEDNRFMMRRLLEMSGYRVVEAVNGEQAVEVATRERPHLILMDLSLPLLDGLAATRRIRQHEALRRIPIIAVSAHDTSDFHADALAAGCNDYVTKPIDFEQLEQLLRRLLPLESEDKTTA